MELATPTKDMRQRLTFKRPAFTKKPKNRTVLLIGGAVVLLAAAIAIKVFLFSGEERVALTGTLTSGSLASTITGTGVTLPADSQTITTASNAEILTVNVSAGDTVAVGDLLYEQDDSEVDTQIEEYQDEISDLQDQLYQYQEQLSELNETMAGLTVTAPFSGHIFDITADEGDSVQKGSKLALLVDDSQMTLTQYFSYSYENQVYVGMSAGVSIPDQMLNLTGTVTDVQLVDRITSEGTRCFAVTVTVDNPGSLTEGMTGAGYLTANSGEKLYPAIEGTLEYAQTKEISAQASGELLAVKKANYQTVTAGQTLFAIDGSSYTTELSNLNSKLTQTQDRISSYEEKILEAEESRANYLVYSEISGKVIQVGVKAGKKPRQSGQTAVLLYNMDTMEISVNIDELQIETITMGMDVTITRSGSNSTQDQTFVGTVTEVSYEATNSNGVAYFPITIEIPAQGALSAGVNVSYTIQVGDASEGVLAPIAALKTTDEGTCLFIQSDKKPDTAIDLEDVDIPDGFYAVPVEVGSSNNQLIRILSGANEGDVVFTRYQQSAPSGGDTASENQQSGDFSFEFNGNGEMPNFGTGEMPSFGGGGGGMPSGGGPTG